MSPTTRGNREEVELAFLAPWAARERMPVQEYRDRSQAQLEELIGRARVSIRVEEEALLHIVDHGRLRNLFERQWDEDRWQDADSFEARRIGEALTFDLAWHDPDLNGVGSRHRCRVARRDPYASSALGAHPIYGHLVDESRPHELGHPTDLEFGPVDLILRRDVHARATFTCGPANMWITAWLARKRWPCEPHELMLPQPTRLDAPDLFAHYLRHPGDERREMKVAIDAPPTDWHRGERLATRIALFSCAHPECFNYVGGPLAETRLDRWVSSRLFSHHLRPDARDFWEVQILGGVSIADVERVEFRQPPLPESIEACEQAELPWSLLWRTA